MDCSKGHTQAYKRVCITSAPIHVYNASVKVLIGSWKSTALAAMISTLTVKGNTYLATASGPNYQLSILSHDA